MYKIDIINELSGRTFGAKIESVSKKNAWIDSCIAKQSWGKNERYVSEEAISEELRSRIISTVITPESGVVGDPAYSPETIVHLVKADYVITETNLNLSKTYRNQKKIEARRSEYRSIEEVMHIILDKGLDSPEMVALQAERAAIKLKYNLEA